MPKLSINIDHIATIREARGTVEPDPLEAGLIAQKSGADGVTVHLRGDRRHIKEKDVLSLKKKLRIKLNLEMSAANELLGIAGRIKPDLVTLVPEKRGELTTQGGLDVINNRNAIRSAIRRLKKKKIPVSIFINPGREQIKAAKEAGADFVEIHTGIYAERSLEGKTVGAELARIKRAVKFAVSIGLKVNAGHGLTYRNTKKIAAIPGITEMSIGHSVISRAALAGLGTAVKEMKKLTAYQRVPPSKRWRAGAVSTCPAPIYHRGEARPVLTGRQRVIAKWK